MCIGCVFGLCGGFLIACVLVWVCVWVVRFGFLFGFRMCLVSFVVG